MMEINGDLHIHSRFSIGVSKFMTLDRLAGGAARKGVQLMGTGDCLHPTWLSEIRERRATPAVRIIDDSVFELAGTRFVLTGEVEDDHRVHHLLIFPSITAVEEMAEGLVGKVKSLASDGRPRVHLDGQGIAAMAEDVGALFGPAHAFTPWTSIYKAHSTLAECYGELARKVSFVELGLSADTDMADRVPEMRSLTFLTNSDAHAPVPLRLAREFTRFRMEDVTFKELELAIRRKDGRGPVLNVGIPPQLGKYHESACIRCRTHFTPSSASAAGWKCGCGGRIKKGVMDRIEELSDGSAPEHPGHRPPYRYLIALAEIIGMAKGRGVNTKSVIGEWEKLVGFFGNEITVLLDAPLEELEGRAAPAVLRGISAFRDGTMVLKPGGGGMYGSIALPV